MSDSPSLLVWPSSWTRCGTLRIFQCIGSIHDLESTVDNSLELMILTVTSHFGHISVILFWISGNIFHIGWNGNYEIWVGNPIGFLKIAHGIWDPHFEVFSSDAYSSLGSDYAVQLETSGIYNWLYCAGFKSNYQLFYFVVEIEILAIFMLAMGILHLSFAEEMLQKGWTSRFSGKEGTLFTWPLRTSCVVYDQTHYRLNYHLGSLIGVFSIAWCFHLVLVSIPVVDMDMYKWPFCLSYYQYLKHLLSCLLCGDWIHTGLTFIGGLKPDTSSLYISDMAHHHMALGVIFVWAGHLYQTIFKGLGHKIRDISFVNGQAGITITLISKSLNLQLSLALAGLSVVVCCVAQHGYSLVPFHFLSYDYVSFVSLFIHHQWIGSILMIGSFAHSGIFLVRDYAMSSAASVQSEHQSDVIALILAHKGAIISHLSWLSLFVGFHTLLVFIHNDSVFAFGEPEKAILIEPVFAQIIQGSSGLVFYQIGMLEPVMDSKSHFDGIGFLPIGPGDLLAHHSIALGMHVTCIILLKGSLDARGSQLMPDKIDFGFSFSCDGPARGGTCDISSWDAVYLAFFWMLNTNSWICFYFHFKQLNVFSQSQLFDESSTYIMGWFRDYLWYNSYALIGGYTAFGANDLAVWSWIFLAAHLCWATGFMFLISWRGYWQEIVDTLLFFHLKTPILCDIWDGKNYTPVALSIVQARFIGLVHFAVGLILVYASFVIGSTS